MFELTEYQVVVYKLFVASFVAGYVVACVLAGAREGHKIERSTRFLVNGYYIHIHHWLAFLVLGGILYLFRLGDPLVYCAILGVVIQGFTYRDWWLFAYKKENFHKIYSRWWNSRWERTLIGLYKRKKAL